MKKYTVLITAPYMLPVVGRFEPVLDKYGIVLIIPDVQERMEETDLLKYAGEFDGGICGDDRYSARVIEASSRAWTLMRDGAPSGTLAARGTIP